jgi:hypothetical protein
MKNEGAATTAIENETRKLPSLTFLLAALGAMAASAGLMFSGKKKWSLFVGQWAPALLIMGTYNKIAKTFSAPYDEDQRLRHGDNPSPYKAPEQRQTPVYGTP